MSIALAKTVISDVYLSRTNPDPRESRVRFMQERARGVEQASHSACIGESLLDHAHGNDLAFESGHFEAKKKARRGAH